MLRPVMRSVLLPLVLLAAPPAAAGPLAYVVAPLVPTVQATPKEAERATGMLRAELKRLRGVRLVPVPAGFSFDGVCDVPCLTRLMAAAGADRAVGGSLNMQPKVWFPGVHWHVTLEQVDRGKGGAWGSYERVYVSSSTKDRFMARAAAALRDADPTKRLPPVGPAPAPPPGTPEVEGMAFVPAGDFVMGSDIGEENDGPRHLVWLDSYYVDLYETSNAEHQQCVAAKACRPPHSFGDADLTRPRHPVVGLDFADATAYCRWRGKRLPTEAEWERAARGTDERRWPWGNEFDPKKVNMRNPDDGWDKSAPVDAFPAGRSPVGAWQMAGNVWEWTTDWFSPIYYRQSQRRNPKGPNSGPRRMIRGGSWRYDIPFYVSSYNRSHSRVGSRFRHVGIRCFKDGPR